MPTLKQLRCEIEWGNAKTPFSEYAITYGDGVVETYIAIPDQPQPFAVHLTSKNYIAEGLAMLVFMDGDYQCNRNRLNLKPSQPGTPRHMTEIDLRVRQKEKSLGDGTYLGRGWRFDKHNIRESSQPSIRVGEFDANSYVVPVDQLPYNVDRQHFEDLGTIDVFVLRCRAKEEVEFRSTTSSDVDDSILQTSDLTNNTLTDEHVYSNTVWPPQAGTLPGTLPNFMNDGTAETYQFGLDGEGPGPTEQKAWSWNTPYPPVSAAHGPSGGYMPGQPSPAQSQPYGSYSHPPGFSQSWPPRPPPSQDQPPIQRSPRHVHFNDQLPRQPFRYDKSAQWSSGQGLSADKGQRQERENPEQSKNYAAKPQSEYPQQALNHGATSDSYATPSLVYGGNSSVPDHSRGFPPGAELHFPRPTPAYQPIGYGVPSYPGWPSPANHAAYAHADWSGQSIPGPNYMTPQAAVAPYQPTNPYPYPQPSFPDGQFIPVALSASSHPGGGIWGPPPPNSFSQDPTKDRNDGQDSQSNQNHRRINNTDGHWSDSNSQGWGNQESDKTQPSDSGWGNQDTSNTQAGDSGWGGNESVGGETNNWNNNSTPVEASTGDWNQAASDVGQNNTSDSFCNTNAGTGTQVQDSWESAPEITPHAAEPFTFPRSATALPAQNRPLYGPHGPYYAAQPIPTARGPQPDAGEEPPYDVPADMPTTHQVKPGEGHVYVHKRRSPEYLDTLEEPYARFVFKYRTKEQIENQIGVKIQDEPTGDEEKRKLQIMNKDEIIEMLLRAKTALGGQIPSPPHIPSEPDERSDHSAEPTAIPAPTYSFLDYQVPAARTTKKIPPPSKLGLGAPITAAPIINTQYPVRNEHWPNNSTVPAASATSAPAPQQLQQNTTTWTAPQQLQHQQSADSWSSPAARHQSNPPAQQQPPISPVQFGTTVQTYQRPLTGPPQAQTGTASDRPVTPPNGGWNAHTHTAPSSSTSDNGMAGWDQAGGGGNAGTGGTDGWGGSATLAAPNQPLGGW